MTPNEAFLNWILPYAAIAIGVVVTIVIAIGIVIAIAIKKPDR